MDNVQSVSRVMPPQVPSQPPGGVIPHFIDRKLDFLLQARATYGDIFRIDMAGTEVVIFGHPRHLQHILVDHARNYSGKGGPRAFRTVSAVVMKNGLATVDSADDLWRQQRKAIQPHLHRRQLDPLADLMVAIIERGIAKWDDTIVPGQPFDVEPGLTHIAMNILVKTMFGTELEPDEVIRFSDRIRNVLDSIWLDLMDTASCEETLPAREHRYQEDLTVIDQMLARLVESRFQEAERGDDLITMLWQLVGMDGISRDQFRDEALSTLIAGYESTAASMSFAFMLLTQHPDVMQNLQTEIDTVLQTRRPT
ncbi:MAG: cytochrome P450, partial [Candidatus Tectomicrobia bacterium]|nr:cytochrome P450 [Candidatus Tectomicrobia bacterium]